MDARARAMAKWPQESAAAVATRVEDFLDTYSSIEKLQEFWTDVKDLTWSESYGSSPWSFATSVAYQVFSSDHRADPILRLQQQRIRYQGDPLLLKYHDDLLRVISVLEDRLILDGDPRQSAVPTRLVRLLSRELKEGTTAVQLPSGEQLSSVRYIEACFDGLGMRDVPYFGVINSPDGLPLSGDLVLYRGTYPDDAGRSPVRSYPMRQLLRGAKAEPDLQELARIFRQTSHGRDGYQWGNTPGNDGDYGCEKLTHLVLLGYVKRTGRDVPNQLGGSWPEVKVTPAGARAIIESGVLLRMQQESPRPVARARGSWGEFDFDAATGAVLGPLYGSDRELDPDGEADLDLAPVRIDIAELQDTYPDEEIAGKCYDILDLGFQNVAGNNAEPDDDWRAEHRASSFSPRP